jgi:hypothetical protein
LLNYVRFNTLLQAIKFVPLRFLGRLCPTTKKLEKSFPNSWS